MANVKEVSFKTIGDSIKNGAADLLSNSDFISRTIGMNNSYEDIMFIVQSLGREPISLLGKDYAFIYDHVRRNYLQGTYVTSKEYENCYKFTFYKEVPTVRFADPYNDPMNLKDRWTPEFATQTTMDNKATIHYSESNDGITNNKAIGYKGDVDSANPGVATGGIYSFGPQLQNCDLIGKTNQNFNHGKYETLIARFHTNADPSKSQTDPTQTANSTAFGQSHGRNLLKKNPTTHNGYDNPYCRVWTYHHQYNQIARQIRPLGDENGEVFTQENLEKRELTGVGAKTVGFRTSESSNLDAVDGFEGGSKRLDKYGVLNYRNGTVNIAPTAKIVDYFKDRQDDYDKQIISLKKCMFSIENLAWRDPKVRKNEYDAYGLSPEQKGPLGGRIMWFPPYDLSFNEDVSVKWNSNEFIGRGENVYTYTNTERRGTLNFTLLIDHPAILDYWTGHERNGMKNQGVGLDQGNIGGVDNKNNQENTLLRFFAGCDILSAKPQEYKVRNIKPITEEGKPQEPKKTVNPTPTKPEEVKVPEHKKMYAILYYPNNYSGKNDDAEFAVNYLMNGVGTQQKIVYKAVSKENVVEDIEPVINHNAGGAIGYEINNGISVVTWNDVKGVKYGVVDGITTEGVAEMLSTSLYTYDGKQIYLAKQIGTLASKGKDVQGASSEWKYRRWYYRVDTAATMSRSAVEERLVGKANNYLDQECHGLNSTGYSWVKDNVKAFNLTDEDDLVSFADLYCAINEEAQGLGADQTNVERIRKMLKEEDGYKITKLTFRGHNSSHGRNPNQGLNTTRNSTLSSNRANTFKNWMVRHNFPMAAEADASKTVSETSQPNNHKNDDVDSPYIKAWRSASVIIEYDKYDISDAATAESTKFEKDISGKEVATVDSVEIKNKETSKSSTMEVVNFEKGLPISNMYNTDIATNAKLSNKAIGITEKTPLGLGFNQADIDMSAKLPKQDTFTESTVKRYDNEGEFFEALDREAPFLHHLISEKIRYFDPAFHSISPEGFNARLTFLHQCTRQGSTVESSSFETASTAYNLAFGRPPVCVLRLGDFYYTKIIIENLSIQYEAPQWDMNPEGIGMMPMFAKITIGFKFLGGSDLAGPIARLQNAVSFNYYANASVYDNRAEKVEYDPNGSGKEIKFKGFNYPNEYIGDKLNHGKIGSKKEDGTIYAEDF